MWAAYYTPVRPSKRHRIMIGYAPLISPQLSFLFDFFSTRVRRTNSAYLTCILSSSSHLCTPLLQYVLEAFTKPTTTAAIRVNRFWLPKLTDGWKRWRQEEELIVRLIAPGRKRLRFCVHQHVKNWNRESARIPVRVTSFWHLVRRHRLGYNRTRRVI